MRCRRAVVVAMVLTLGGCSASNHSDFVTGRKMPALRYPEFVVAGANGAWIGDLIEPSPRFGSVKFWKVGINGVVFASGRTPKLAGLDVTALGDNLVVAGIDCAHGDDLDGCRRGRGIVQVIRSDGTPVGAPAVVWNPNRPPGDGDGVAIVGTTSDSVWVLSDNGLSEVDEHGKVRSHLPFTPGGSCVVGGTLYLVPPPSGLTVGTTPTGKKLVPVTVERHEGNGWVAAPFADHSIATANYRMFCQRDSIAFAGGASRAAVLVTWSPSQGWHDATHARAAPLAPFDVDAKSGLYGQASDGRVMRVDGDNRAIATPLRLPVMKKPQRPEASLKVDASPSIVAGCIEQSATPVILGVTKTSRADVSCQVAINR
jgi:hypothetical protein